MSWIITLHLFLSTTLFINTVLPAQSSFVSYSAKATKDAKTTADKQQTEVEALVASFANLNLEDGDFSPLPQEIVHNIIHLVKRDYPWEDVIQFVNMRKVCKRWLCILSNMDAIAKHLKVPPLHFAAMKNDANEVMCLKMTNECSLLEPDCRGFRAAHYALAIKAHGAIKMLKIGTALDTLKQKPADLQSFVPNDPETLRMLFAKYDKECTVEELVDFIKKNDFVGLQEALSRMENPLVIIKLPLHIPEDFADISAFKLLLCFALASRLEGTLFEAMDENMNPADHIFTLFKGCGANPNACDGLGRTLLTRACIYPELLPTVTELLKCENIDVNLPSKDEAMHTPFHVAAYSNNIPAAQALLALKDSEGKCRVNINAKNWYGCTPLYTTARKDDLYNLFVLLLQHGADPNIQQNNETRFAPIHLAAYNGCVKILDALTNNPTCNIELLNAEGDTALGIAALHDQKACIKLLLQKKAYASCRDKQGNTLLHNTAREGYIKSMRKLLPYMFHLIDTPNNNSFAPLHIAAMKGKIECARLLLNAGATVGIKTKNGDTPLHYAASNNNVQGIELLFINGACIDAQNNKKFILKDMNVGGYTPLHCAAHRGHLPAVQKLVELGADIDIKTTLGKKPLDLAYDFGHQEVGKYLAEKTSLLTLEHIQQIKNW